MPFRVMHFDEDPECVLQACGYSASIRVTPTATRRYVLPSQQMAAVSSVVQMMVMCTSGARTAQALLLRQQAKRYAAVILKIEWQLQNGKSCHSIEPSIVHSLSLWCVYAMQLLLQLSSGALECKGIICVDFGC
jgi:hypothetical protein